MAAKCDASTGMKGTYGGGSEKNTRGPGGPATAAGLGPTYMRKGKGSTAKANKSYFGSKGTR